MTVSSTALVPGQLYALLHPYELNGLVTTHPRAATGFASSNAYLLLEDDHAMLVDTGLSIHEREIVSELERLVGQRSLSLSLLRIGEFAGVCNVRPIAERLTVDQLYGMFHPTAAAWLDFRPEFAPSLCQPGGGGRLRGVQEHQPAVGDMLPIGHRRSVELLAAPLRLLVTRWLYDAATQTLFTSDLFGWLSQSDADGPWVIRDEDADPVSEDEIREYLFGGRFWWLPGAQTDRIRAEIADIFERYEITTIAPAFGCVMHGRRVVERHYAVLDRILARAPREPRSDIALELMASGR